MSNEFKEICTCNVQDTSYYQNYYPGGCPCCDSPRCPCCGRILSPYRVYPYYPAWKENEPIWISTPDAIWGTDTVTDSGNYQVWM